MLREKITTALTVLSAVLLVLILMVLGSIAVWSAF